MSMTITRPFVCQSCLRLWRNSALREMASQRVAFISTTITPKPSQSRSTGQEKARSSGLPPKTLPRWEVSEPHTAVGQRVHRTLEQPSIPSEDEVIETLGDLEAAAVDLCHRLDPETAAQAPQKSPTSAILSLNGRPSPKYRSSRQTDSINGEANNISNLAYKFLKDPRVFITPAALERYVTIQSILSHPESFPELFDLYATKPQPQTTDLKSRKASFSSPKPDAAASAVPLPAAHLALGAAIETRDLPLALSIIAMSFEKLAFRRNKFIRKGLPPVIGAALTPLAAWTLAANMSEIQTGLPQESFMQIAFAGFATYAAAVGTIGYVALTSANDQMRRVTWAIGMPLRERWVREEERAALDRVACAWGFKESWRWGEEDGRDWAELKDWIGTRGMVLDKVSLMEGME